MLAAADAALAGRRVLELADESGVYCGKLLADMGADVIKIERPGGDATRDIPPFLGERPGEDASLFFLYMNTSKRGVTLDIATPEGRDLFERLAAVGVDYQQVVAGLEEAGVSAFSEAWTTLLELVERAQAHGR